LYIFQLAAMSGLRGMVVWFLREIVVEGGCGYGDAGHRLTQGTGCRVGPSRIPTSVLVGIADAREDLRLWLARLGSQPSLRMTCGDKEEGAVRVS